MADNKDKENTAEALKETNIDLTPAEAAAIIEENAALKKAAAELASENAALKENPATKKLPTKTFKVGSKEYRFTAAAFYLGGKKVTAEDALKDKNIQKELVEIGSGVIEPIKKK